MPLLQRMFPFATALEKKKEVVQDVSTINPAKLMKIKTLGIDFHNSLIQYATNSKNRGNFEQAAYDFERIIEAIDTDSFVKQAFLKYKELFFKEGWEIIGENPDAVNYLYQRIDLMEETMNRPFNDYLMEVVDNLVKFSNVFIVKARGDIAKYFPGRLYPEDGQFPIAGFYTIPTETVRILRNKYNQPLKYKQTMSDLPYATDNIVDPTFDASEVIHLYLEKKPGRAFGTPFIVSTLDDVIALRQIEEDVQNLIHKELFPLYKYKVGTDDSPALPGDVEAAAEQLANLRVEGGLIIPNTHDVEVIGGEGKALDATSYLEMMRARVIAGLGIAPHHLGIMNAGGNKAVTDRLDIALYDKVKVLQDYVENTIRLYIFNPLLREGGFDLTESPREKGSSNRCFMRFKEIDIDTQIKKENHVIQKFAGNIIDLEETRLALGEDAEYDMGHMLMTLTAHVQTISQMAVAQQQAALQPVVTKSATGGQTTKPPAGLPKPTKPDAQNPSTGILPNMPNNKKGIGNLDKPANQHGRRMSPNVRHMDDDILNTIVELLDSEDNFNE